MSTLVKISYTLPESHILDLMQLLIEMKQGLDDDGIESRIEVQKDATMPASPMLDIGAAPMARRGRKQEVSPDMVERPRAAKGGTQSVQMPAAMRGRTGGRVAYRVIDPRIKVGETPDKVRMLLLQHGPMSAQKVEELSGHGKKSVESSLWLLRNKGSIESVEVQDGKAITQKKFSKAQIKQGRATAPYDATT